LENGEGSSDATPCAKALYFYVGTNADELSFDKGDVITLTEKVSTEWYKGEIGKSVGLFPANYVDVIVDLPFETCKDFSVVDQTAKDDSSKSGLHTTNNIVAMEKPALKPKPLIKPKVNETANKTKPLLLKSSKQHQRNQAPRKIPEASKQKFVENHYIDKKLEMPKNGNQLVTGEDTAILKAKNTQKPSRPPSFNVPSDQILSEQGKKPNKGDSHKKPLSNVTERPPRPKNIRHSAKPPALENDMPLLSSNKHTKKFEAKTKNSSQLISPSLKLLESELDSTDLRSEIKVTHNSTFYVSNENPMIFNEDVEEKPKIKPKRPAPQRPQRHPSKEQIFIESKIYNEESSSPKLPLRGTLSRQSPSGSPNLLRSKGIEKQQVVSRTKPSVPSLPKPLAPQPPHKPLVPPKSQKSSEQFGAEKSSFEGVFQPSESALVNGSARSTVGKQESKMDGMRSSFFYVDFFAGDVVDGKECNVQSQDIESVEQKISLIQGQIESESSMLFGIESLLKDSEDESKRKALISRQRTLSSSLMDLNEELFAYQDEKSYLLASCGDIIAIRNRIEDLSKQIESYKDNGVKLRRMKDIARIEEVEEIKDGIEFCDHMVETLQDEIVVLRKEVEKEEEKKEEDPVVVRRRLLIQRQKAIKELIHTEKDYHRDIEVCSAKILPQLKESKAIEHEKLFGNLAEICTISSKLLEALGELDVGNEGGIGEKIGQCFIQLRDELEKEYSNYCRNYDESQNLLEKLEQDVERRDEIFNAVATSKDETGLWDLSSYLIKPVQRILKYPLILQEIHKLSPEDDPDRESLQKAIKILRNVASAINEFKRRKDLVQKYQKTEGIGNKIQRLNWHSVRKKSSRINQKITQFTGLVSQTVDETFIEEEKRFRAIEKLIKYLNRNFALYLELFQESNNIQKVVAEDIRILSAGTFIEDEVGTFYNAIVKLKDVIFPQFVSAVKSRVFDPLDRLLQLFQSPMKLIEKRQDKCLDYDSLMNRAQKNKDAEKSRQFSDELNMAKNNYEALNSQLLEELPRFTSKCMTFIKCCLSNFVKARRIYLSEFTEEIRLLLQLHLIERYTNAEVVQKHAESLFVAAEKVLHLAFYPEKFSFHDGPVKADLSSFSRENFSFHADMLFEQSDSDPTSPIKPSSPDLENSRKNHQGETRPVPLPRRRSIRKSSNSNSSSSPIKSPGLYLDSRGAEKKRPILSEELASIALAQNDELYVAEYTFEKEDAAEMSIEEGTVVEVIRKHDKEGNSEWWLVQTADARGYVPSSYLKPREKVEGNGRSESPENDVGFDVNGISRSEGVADREEHNVGTPMNKTDGYLCVSAIDPDLRLTSSSDSDTETNVFTSSEVMYKVLYDFETTEREEISVEEGDIVKVLKVGDDSGNDEWCFIEAKGKQGYVPFNYLEPAW